MRALSHWGADIRVPEFADDFAEPETQDNSGLLLLFHSESPPLVTGVGLGLGLG